MSNELEVLEKGKCVRCGGKTSGGKGGRCAACLAKLRTAKKTPGSAQRAQTKADDSLRRQAGKNGTASKKKSGLGSRKEIVKKIQSAEKKTGQKLSPDRVNNSKGYASSNVRAVPEKLNVGRHKVDPKKLANWKKRLKKNIDMTIDDFKTLLTAKAYELGNEDLAKSIENMPEDVLFKFMVLGE